MKSAHRVHHTDARDLSQLDTNSVELVVTSPPYPMIEMWDDLFSNLNATIADVLADGDGTRAFHLMHDELAKVWDEIKRILVPGGIAAINVGDATRTIGGHFEVYPNHRRISREFTNRNFHRLPHILWHKPTNSGAKFMGSGMIPPNAYPTLEHEYILLFRNGTRRTNFDGDNIRYKSAYFWEERNTWFTDLWTDIQGRGQKLSNVPTRDRSAAFPIDIPSRLIRMYSVHGDTVLDPFWGTGTTMLAAILTGRNSVGTEINEDLIEEFTNHQSIDFEAMSEEYLAHRLEQHAKFVNDVEKPPKYTISGTDIPIVTQQEQDMAFYGIDNVTNVDRGYDVSYREYTAEQLNKLFQKME